MPESIRICEIASAFCCLLITLFMCCAIIVCKDKLSGMLRDAYVKISLFFFVGR